MISDKTLEWKNAQGVFGLRADELNFNVPVFKSKTKNVPAVDPSYKFRAKYLVPVLRALVTNKKAWLSGHTGTGKSTLVAQVCAHLNWPMIRVNFDSEISRMDLVGRDILTVDGAGNTVSEFIDGILPQALTTRCVLLCDEVDFIRPDVAYVFQRTLEDEGLMISEDGGRVITPHKHFRLMATANTRGQGDENGIYQGARAQSLAFLDRFSMWIECDYLERTQETQLVKEAFPKLDKDLVKQIMDYTAEHRQGFNDLKISQPISPRTILALAEEVEFFDSIGNTNPLQRAATDIIINKANSTDGKVIVGILDRVAKEKVTAASKAIQTKKLESELDDIGESISKIRTSKTKSAA